MIRIPTRGLVDHLTDLALTAADPADSGATAGVLLHTAKGYDRDDNPSDLLVGTSTNHLVLGHAHTPCAGQSDEPMLWLIGDVRALLAVLKPLAKLPDHAVEIKREGKEFHVSEDPNLFGDGLTLTFPAADPEDYPTQPWDLLREVRMTPDEDAAPALPRTDIPADRLLPFVKIAARRNVMPTIYRYHQALPIHVEIGTDYRGVISPFRWNDTIPGAGLAPSGDVYPLVLDGVPA